MRLIDWNYWDNVFINCPFDEDYRDMLEGIIFICIYWNLNPCISENVNSGTLRLDGLKDLIYNCRFSIHDISRYNLKKNDNIKNKREESSRFNMPFELGLDLGCQYFGENHLKDKKCLVIMDNPNIYDEILSDLSGNDIVGHSGSIEELSIHLRNFFVKNHIIEQEWSEDEALASGFFVAKEFREFRADLDLMLLDELSFEIGESSKISISEYITYCEKWIEERKYISID